MSTERRCIVIARAEDDVVWDGQPFASDLGQRPKFVPTRRAVAMVWVTEREGDDVALERQKAAAFAAKDGYAVFEFPADEPDPLGKARAAVLA